MIAALAGVLWEFRPRLRRTPRFSTAERPPRPEVRVFARPEPDPLLVPLAAMGGDLPAHQLVHAGQPLTRTDKETHG